MANRNNKDWIGIAGRSVANILELDVDAVEFALLHSLHDAADQAQLDWIDLMYRLQAPEAVYHVGEMAPAGHLECSNCGSPLEIYMPQTLQPCMQCKNTEFIYSDLKVH